jgi:hypothetical protein
MSCQAITEYASIIEQVIEVEYKEILPLLNSSEKQKIIDIERIFSRKETPLNTLGLGRWVTFMQESGMLELLSKYIGINKEAFNFIKLRSVIEIRNKCAHEDYQASQEEFQIVHDCVVEMLKNLHLLEHEPTMLSQEEVLLERKEISSWTEQIRLNLSSDPLFEFSASDLEMWGYEFYGKWEFVGAISDSKHVIYILLYQRELDCLDTIYDDILEKVSEKIKEKICKILPSLEQVSLIVEIADGFSWGEWEFEFIL